MALLAACGGRAVAPTAPPPASSASATEAPAASEETAAVPVFADDAVRGSREAPVTIVVFSDFECPACRSFASRLEQVRSTYAKTDTRVVFKNYPLRQHRNARLIAEVGQGVLVTHGADAFFRFHDAAFAKPGAPEEADVLAWAEAAGASSSEIQTGLADKRWSSKIDRDMEQGRKLGLQGTPTIYVNGIDVADDAELKVAIDDQLPKARALLAQGVPADKVYTKLADANAAARETPAEEEPKKVDAAVWRVPVGASPARGPRNARVTVVVFSDFECPFCKRVEPTVERLFREYPGKVRIVWKDQPLPFHKSALPAARLAREARNQRGDAGFWDMHGRLFESSPRLDNEDLEKLARAAGLDVAKAMAAVKNAKNDASIEEDQILGDDVEAAGTPHFFVNGRRLTGAQPYESFKSLVDEELAKADALIAKGTPAEGVYDAIMKDAGSAPAPERVAVAPPTAKAPFRGYANAKVVIQEFSEFQCPYCKRAEPTVDKLLEANPGTLKVVFRHYPLSFHPHAQLAAEAAQEAFVQKGNAGFSKMRELLFENQGNPGGLEREALDRYAKTIGLDTKRFAKALDTHANAPAIEADKKAAEEAGIRGTPNFVINGYLLTGAQPLRKFQRVVKLAQDDAKTSPTTGAQPQPAR